MMGEEKSDTEIFTEKIPERLKYRLRNPSVPTPGHGVIIDEKRYNWLYTEGFPFFADPTKGPEFIINLVKQKFLEADPSPLKKRDRYLEIGPGPGMFVEANSPYFKSVTVCEPSPFMRVMWEDKHPDWNVFPDVFQNFDVPEGGFDMIYCSHVLYYVDLTLWPAFLQKIYDSLSPGGVAVITMNGATGECIDDVRTFNKFGPHAGLIEAFFKYIDVKYETARDVNLFQTNTFEEMLPLVEFLMVEMAYTQDWYRNQTVAERARLEGRIEQLTHSARKKSGIYVYEWINGHVMVYKEDKKQSKL